MQSDRCERRGSDDEHDCRKRSANERPDRGDSECCSAAPFSRHLVTVYACDRRSTLTRHIDQHAGDRSSVHRPVIDRREHNDGARSVELERQRHKDRDTRDRADSRQNADSRTNDRA